MKNRASRHPDAIRSIDLFLRTRRRFNTSKYRLLFFYTAYFFMRSSHEISITRNRWFLEGGYRSNQSDLHGRYYICCSCVFTFATSALTEAVLRFTRMD